MPERYFFLWREEIEIWRQSVCKTHFAEDRRYPFDHEDVVYTVKFDAIDKASISPESQAEIKKTSVFVLIRKIAFVDDEVDALVGVVLMSLLRH